MGWAQHNFHFITLLIFILLVQYVHVNFVFFLVFNVSSTIGHRRAWLVRVLEVNESFHDCEWNFNEFLFFLCFFLARLSIVLSLIIGVRYFFWRNMKINNYWPMNLLLLTMISLFLKCRLCLLLFIVVYVCSVMAVLAQKEKKVLITPKRIIIIFREITIKLTSFYDFFFHKINRIWNIYCDPTGSWNVAQVGRRNRWRIRTFTLTLKSISTEEWRVKQPWQALVQVLMHSNIRIS